MWIIVEHFDFEINKLDKTPSDGILANWIERCKTMNAAGICALLTDVNDGWNVTVCSCETSHINKKTRRSLKHVVYTYIWPYDKIRLIVQFTVFKTQIMVTNERKPSITWNIKRQFAHYIVSMMTWLPFNRNWHMMSVL